MCIRDRYTTGTIIYVFAVPYAYLLLGVAEIAVVLFLSARIHKMSVGTARALFFTYAVLNGVVSVSYTHLAGQQSGLYDCKVLPLCRYLQSG